MLSNLKLSWTGDLASLKTFVENNLNLQGTWSSPGEEKKLFVAENLTIQWLKNKKFLSIEGKNVNKVVHYLIEYICSDSDQQNYDACNIDNTEIHSKKKATNVIMDGEFLMESQSSVICRCSELSHEVADLKLDLVSIESKLCERIHTIENKISSMNDHTKEEFSICGNLTTNVPTTPMLVVRDGEKLAEKLREYNNDNENEYINRDTKAKVRNDLYHNCSNDNVAIIDNSLSENDSYNQEKESRGNQKSYAKIVASDSNVTYSEKTVDKNKSIKQNQTPEVSITKVAKSSCDSDGFVGVVRNRTRTKKYFVSGIAENVNENHILSYLREREITPTYISIFRSKRQGSLSAKVNIPKAVCSLVEQKGFWPMHVSCKPWKPSNQEKNCATQRCYNQ